MFESLCALPVVCALPGDVRCQGICRIRWCVPDVLHRCWCNGEAVSGPAVAPRFCSHAASLSAAGWSLPLLVSAVQVLLHEVGCTIGTFLKVEQSRGEHNFVLYCPKRAPPAHTTLRFYVFDFFPLFLTDLRASGALLASGTTLSEGSSHDSGQFVSIF